MAYPFFITKLIARAGLAGMFPGLTRHAAGAEGFLHHYADRVLAAPLDELATAARFFEPAGPDVIDLALGAPRFDLAPSGSTRLPVDRRGPPPALGLPELRQAVAERLHAEDHITADPADGVLVTHGATGAFSTVVDAFLNPGRAAVLFDPCSPLFAMVLRQRRARIRWVPTWTENGRVRFHPEPFARAMRGAKLLALADPVNPTGAVFAPEDLEQIAWWAERHDVLICQDTSFDRFQYDGDRRRLAALPAAAARTVTVGGVSKGHGLAAARVGWLAGHRHLVRPCALTQTLTTPFVPTLCQQIALSALSLPAERFAPIHVEFEAKRRYVLERLTGMKLAPAAPAGGFFVWLPVYPLGVDGRAFAERLLAAKQVLVTPGELYGPGGRGFVRLSFAAEDGRLREGLSRLAEFLPTLRPAITTPPAAPPVARLAPPESQAA